MKISTHTQRPSLYGEMMKAPIGDDRGAQTQKQVLARYALDF